ncbi:MAG TPA: 3-oxoacyl-ACP reductase, partial [Conexibacter sp.]|nr:3-oxoacyl-ACP reductase [Conexibacter sp.]
WTPKASVDHRYGALVFDATGIAETAQLEELHAFFHPTIRQVAKCARVIVLGTPPAAARAPAEAVAQRALEGFTRATGKEIGRGATVQLVYVEPGAEDQLAGTLRFLLSPRSAFVSGQVVRIGRAADGRGGRDPELDWEQPLAGKVALVTGASRGIGAAIASTLARDGAHVVGLDVPALADDLRAVADGIGGSALPIDITADDAPQAIAKHLKKEHRGVDVVVHNAGITRDRTLGRMDADRWNAVIGVNLSAIERVTDALLAGASRAVLNRGGRVVCVSSISGIAGNAGQTNYATSKAGVIGVVDAYAPELVRRGATINAVAPGFIETQMTAKVPIAIREAGRRMSSLSQGGLPIDVAETIAWFASPASAGVNGNVVRVCGQSLLGA